MQRATCLCLAILACGCSFDSTGLEAKNQCSEIFDCVDGYYCISGICEKLIQPEVLIREDSRNQDDNDEKTDEPDTENNIECVKEICDNQDNDCDGEIDENFKVGEHCENGKGVCTGTGHFFCETHEYSFCNAEERSWLKTDEVCDSLDNDCDGETDENLEDCCIVTETRICGNSNIGECRLGRQTCLAFGTWSECNSKNPEHDICDGLDNDCDEEIDDGFLIGEYCEIGNGVCRALGQIACDGDLLSNCDAEEKLWLKTDEICDGLDNDCDGETDENNPCQPQGICLEGQCLDMNCQIMEYQNHTYAYCNQELVWIEAVQYCRRFNSHLATINDLLEDGYFYTLQLGYFSAWIGLNDIAQENTWVWESGEISDVLEWASGEPNNSQAIGASGEDCVEIRIDLPPNGGWNDAFCGLTRPFFCEWNELF